MKRNVIFSWPQLDQTSLGLPTKDYFLEASNTMYLMAYKNYLITIATLLGASLKSASIHAEELIHFEIQLANVSILETPIFCLFFFLIDCMLTDNFIAERETKFLGAL